MSGPNLPLLLCTNGDENTRPALQYGVWLANLLRTSVVLLGVVEEPGKRREVERFLEEASSGLQTLGVPFQRRMDEGQGSQVIAEHASKGDYLTVIGRLGRPAWRRVVQGRSFRRILEKVASPILYVPVARLQLERMLICMGGLGYAVSMEHIGLYLARAAGASVTLLHVVGPINLDYPLAKEVQDHWQTILDTDTPQGRFLGDAVREIREAGLKVEFKVRHGNVIHEILDEIHQGDYDLVGMGSPYSAHSLRHLYMPNVTAEVAESLECPVLTVRTGYELIE